MRKTLSYPKYGAFIADFQHVTTTCFLSNSLKETFAKMIQICFIINKRKIKKLLTQRNYDFSRNF